MHLSTLLLDKYQESLLSPKVALVGFDGVTDEILEVIDKRKSSQEYIKLPTIESFSERIGTTSNNLEWVPQTIKIGGNGPILAQAMVEGGHLIDLIGTLGKESIEPIFRPLTDRCRSVVTLGPSAYSNAVEFNDGKVIFGKLQPLLEINYAELSKKADLKNLFENADLIVSANWTMIPETTSIWKKIIIDVVPKLSKKKRYFFVDLADPAKRTNEDLKEALDTLKLLNSAFEVILGVNEIEEKRIREVYGVLSGISKLVVHTPYKAWTKEVEVESFYTPTPKLSTGAGDNFNAGYLNGLLFGLSDEQSLLLGCATSGFYVREGRSPTMNELADFLKLRHY